MPVSLHESRAAIAVLPVTPEMAWTVPQLLKRCRLVAPGIATTTGVLRGVIRMPEHDGRFVKALTDSGFLSCDRAIGQVRWKLDIDEMMAMYRSAAGAQVPAHCRSLLLRERANEPFDWEVVLADLRALNSSLPELLTIELLEQLYTRLHALHVRSVQAARSWLAFQGAHHA